MEKQKYTWLKSKGYKHITAQIDVNKREREIINKVLNPSYVSTYAFYPLIHTSIKERKYKSGGINGERAHVHVDENGNYVKTFKSRPLHYATHMDAIIFGYYADIIQQKYELELKKNKELDESIIAYRKIPVDNEIINKSTIHFANEVFKEIKKRLIQDGTSVVLAFDIKSFFPSLDHKILKSAWAKLFNWKSLPLDHYNVFKASTKFSYILLDDLRIHSSVKGRKAGFDEKKLAEIRNKLGINSFFASPQEFRDKIKSGELKIYKYPKRNKNKEPIGIPQGLPISAVLANLYLIDFDKAILTDLIIGKGCFYRRYSDDIIIVCKQEDANSINDYIENKIKELKIEVSTAKTERFIFSKGQNSKITCTKIMYNGTVKIAPLIYLGFEFNGNNILIKSANLAKFYRRMISSIKSKAKRAKKQSEKTPYKKAAIFRRQLYKLYTTKSLSNTKVFTRNKRFVKNDVGEFRIISTPKKKILRSNYLSYSRRASEIMEEPAIINQLRNHKKIFNIAINKHLKND